MPTPEVQLQIASGEVCIANSAVTRALTDPTQAHTLPGACMDLRDAVNQFLDLLATHKPVAYLCLRRELRSLKDLHVSEAAALTVERAQA